MRGRSERAERLWAGVETAFGSGAFEVDERLRVEEVWQRSDRAVSTAILSVRIDDEFDAEEVRRRYHPDRRIIIMTDEADLSARVILFEGYPPVQSSRWDGRIGREEEERYVFEAEHVFERLARGRESLVFGRYVRNGAIEDGLAVDPETFADQSVLVTALPCVFNPDGVGNRALTALTVAAPGGGTRPVHLFTYEQDEAAKWTYAAALRYLTWFYLPKEGPVFEGNVFEVTEALVSGGTVPGDALGAALARQPVSLTCEATSLVEALSLLADAAGIHITAETENVAGRPVTRLRVWAPEGGALHRLHLVRGGRWADGEPRYSTAGRSASEVLSANNTHRGAVSWDHRGIVNSPVVLGDVKRYEMTVPLWPGWIPRDGLDNVAPGNRPAAKATALTPDEVESLGDAAENYEWFRRYHRRGSEFKVDADVGRLWVLNEDGFYYGALYNRNAPFDDYGPFDFSTVADAAVTTRGAWMRRRRRLLPTISRSKDGRPLGVWVEISFDWGSTWQQQSSGVRVLEDRCGVYFEAENPTEVTPTGKDPRDQNLWYALVDQTFRVRVTAVIEGDERLLGTSPPDELASPTLHLNGMIVRRPRSFQFASRSHTTNMLAEVVSSGGPVERDDSPAIAALAEQLARANQDRQVRVAPSIPWVETGYAMGDRIGEIRGRHLRFATTVGAETRFPAVLERRFVLRDERYETELTLGITEVPGAAV